VTFDIVVQWTTVDKDSRATDHVVWTTDPTEWPPGYPTLAPTLVIEPIVAAVLGCPTGTYEHISEAGTVVALGITVPIFVYRKMA
jgi:hypothetical protein